MAKHTVVLTEHFTRYIEQAVADGHYADANELLQDALRLHEERREEHALKLQRLREAVRVGLDQLDRGEYRQFSVDEIDSVMDELNERASAQARKAG